MGRFRGFVVTLFLWPKNLFCRLSSETREHSKHPTLAHFPVRKLDLFLAFEFSNLFHYPVFRPSPIHLQGSTLLNPRDPHCHYNRIQVLGLLLLQRTRLTRPLDTMKTLKEYQATFGTYTFDLCLG